MGRTIAAGRDLVGRGGVGEQAALALNTSSSVVSQPMPWMKPPSIWPRSMAGFSDLPTSCRMSARVTFISPVRVSISTSTQAAP
jgi:hypothetical protein